MVRVYENWSEQNYIKFVNNDWCVSCAYGDDVDWIDDLINSDFKQEWECDALIEALQKDKNEMTLNQIFVKYTNNNYPYIVDAE